MSTLVLDIVGPQGALVHEEGLDVVVFRRRESSHDPGSEVAIFPRHAPLLAQAQRCELRYRRGAEVYCLGIGDCLVEVWEDRVTCALT